MPTIRFTSDSPVGLQVDALTQSLLADFPEAERTRITNDLRATQHVFDDADKGANDASASRQFTMLGLAGAVKRIKDTAEAALKAHDDTAAKREAEAAATRAKALQRPAEGPTEGLVREIRDGLKGLDSLEVEGLYFSAIERADWPLIIALEDAPVIVQKQPDGQVRQFHLLTPELRKRGDDLKIDRSPLADQLAEQDAVAYLYRATVATVRTELAKLAERHGLNLRELE